MNPQILYDRRIKKLSGYYKPNDTITEHNGKFIFFGRLNEDKQWCFVIDSKTDGLIKACDIIDDYLRIAFGIKPSRKYQKQQSEAWKKRYRNDDEFRRKALESCHRWYRKKLAEQGKEVHVPQTTEQLKANHRARNNARYRLLSGKTRTDELIMIDKNGKKYYRWV